MTRAAGRTFLALCSIYLTTGCALGTTPLSVKHSPFVGAACPSRGVSIVVRPFKDLRPVEQRPYIGAKRNAYGMVLGHVSVREGQPLAEALTGFIIDALQQAGYRAVLDGKQQGFEPDAVVEGDILVFWLDMYVATWHRLELDVRLLDSKEHATWERVFVGEETNALWFGVSSELETVIQQAIDRALAHAVVEFASESFDEHVRPASELPTAPLCGSLPAPGAPTERPSTPTKDWD